MSADGPDHAIAELGNRLCRKMWHLDPDSTEPPSWIALSDYEREFYTTCVRDLLSCPDLITSALGGSDFGSCHHVVAREPKGC